MQIKLPYKCIRWCNLEQKCLFPAPPSLQCHWYN